MNVFIHRLETFVPQHSSTQDALALRMGAWAGDVATARIIRHVFQRSGIERRYSVLADFTEPDRAQLFRTDTEGRFIEPSTQERNQIFSKRAGPMAVNLARRLMDDESGFRLEEVTHVITVSCTGFVNPGPDWHLVTELGLSPTVERYNLGFMGCYAALPALRMARQFCQAQPDAVVLVVCLELCSLHMQMKTNADSILGNALFSDGAAAALVSAQPPAADRPALVLEAFMSALAPEGQGEMAWEIGNHGFDLVLSSYVPDIIETNVERVVGDLLAPRELTPIDIDLWAVHPGGKAILDKVEKSLMLEAHQIAASRSVLRNFGNMSSATILFVLEQMLNEPATKPQTIAAMAFGPGLTIECGLLEFVPARTAVNEEHHLFASAAI
jgi:predicted naringenin-chalcone synthase